jgi:HTH-type transcriptional regulator / antitoxin HigA
MQRTAEFQPEWASPPGETLASLMNRIGMSIKALSTEIDCSIDACRALLDGVGHLDEFVAERLEKVFGVSKSFWLQREYQYRADLKRQEIVTTEISARELLGKLPVANMRHFGWVECGLDLKSKLNAVLKFFGVKDASEYHALYSGELSAVAFRESLTFASDSYSTTAWLRKGTLEAERISCGGWDKRKFMRLMPEIRKLCRTKDPSVFLPKLTKVCADCGVAFVVVPAPKGCRASGATRFLSPKKALIVMSLRYKTDDQFWFTFFHEAAHLILHSEDALFLEDNSEVTLEEEAEANEFAAEVLVPAEIWDRVKFSKLSHKSLISAAFKIGVSPGILLGQLQHKRVVSLDKMNYLKRRYSWDDAGRPTLIP